MAEYPVLYSVIIEKAHFLSHIIVYISAISTLYKKYLNLYSVNSANCRLIPIPKSVELRGFISVSNSQKENPIHMDGVSF